MMDGTRMLTDKRKPLIVNTDVAAAMSADGKNVENKRNWMVLDKETLCFNAYYKTKIFNGPKDMDVNVRKMNIIYFLVDETIKVNETKQPNSGTAQGCFIKRQLIPLPGGNQKTGPYYKVTDLIIGETVNFYGKQLHITGANDYTRDFLLKMGMVIKDNETVPIDPYFTYRKRTELDPLPKIKSIKYKNYQSLQLDDDTCSILRFKGYSEEKNGHNVRNLHILYYLVDDTIEIREMIEKTKSCKQECVVFLKRQKIPKNGPWCVFPGQNIKQNLLNSITNASDSTYYMLDRHSLKPAVEHIHYTDLFIGATFSAKGNDVVLTECNEVTEQFYVDNLGVDVNVFKASQNESEVKQENTDKTIEAEIDKNNSVLRETLLIRIKEPIVFGFDIRLNNCSDPSNPMRKFSLKYYLNDAQFSIYECKELVAGLRGGYFLSKRGFNEKDQKKFTFQELAVGLNIYVNGFEFKIIDVDENTLKFFINNPEEFPHSNFEALFCKTHSFIKERFQSIDEFFTQAFQDRELVNRDEFRQIMSFNKKLDDHTGVVLAFIYKRKEPYEPYTSNDFQNVVQDILRRAQFIHFDGLKRNLRSRKLTSDKKDYVLIKEAIKAVKSCKIPLSSEVINLIFNEFKHEEQDIVNYEEMVDWLDYITNPVQQQRVFANDVLFVKPKKPWVKVKEFVDDLKKKDDKYFKAK
ncbi:Uncharacterised domain DM10,Domain of unknown function DUF1126,EF-hand domain pair [Cinara cedri]|uniref:DM10 domain-containing protein n=1 Tax=Cinara cedri TaxID=506608 RepID=A0A5E4MEQ6_9HEMI|nr:Uncharacterised domain DM10,Domain of unknown function DUF1126,EF-hand domain pair [Cinara cedri]